jgi:serine/threonine protein kinase
MDVISPKAGNPAAKKKTGFGNFFGIFQKGGKNGNKSSFFGSFIKKKPAKAKELSSRTSAGSSTSSMVLELDQEESKMDTSGNESGTLPQSQSIEKFTGTFNGNRMVLGYELGDTLGKGMSGKVKRGFHRTSGEFVALKIIDKDKTPSRILALLDTEIRVMQKLSAHDSILKLLHYDAQISYPRKRGGIKNTVCMALEIAENGELFDFMLSTGAFHEKLARSLFKQLADALAFCHANNITHRDIKPENLLLDGRFQLKVADFGLAAMRDSADDLLKTECGTRSYMAPEVLARRKYDGKKTDCWSIGVVLFILLSGNPPFQIARADQDWWFMQLVQDRPDRFWRSHKRYYPNFPQGPQKLITDMFKPDPSKRLSVQEVSQHPWVNADLMTPDEIYAEMSERKLKVDADKRAEKEKALAKKAAKAKNNQDFDPFNKDVHRSIGGSSSEVEEIIRMPEPNPVPEEGLRGFTNFYIMEKLPALTDSIPIALVKVLGSDLVSHEKVGEYTWDVLTKLQVKFSVCILYSQEDKIFVIDVQRLYGDSLGYNMMYKKFKSALKALLGEGDDETTDTDFGTTELVPLTDEELDAEDVIVSVKNNETLLDNEVDMM